MAGTKTEEYTLLDGRVIRCRYDRLRMAKISRDNMESFIKEFNTSYRQAKILETIKENYASIKATMVEREKIDKAIDNIYKIRNEVLYSIGCYEQNDVLDIIDDISKLFEEI